MTLSSFYSSSSKATSYDFKPRKTQKTNSDGSAASNPNPHKPKAAPKNSATGESYTDRAEARRKGLDDEFAEVERLREEFQKRAEGGEIGKEEVSRIDKMITIPQSLVEGGLRNEAA